MHTYIHTYMLTYIHLGWTFGMLYTVAFLSHPPNNLSLHSFNNQSIHSTVHPPIHAFCCLSIFPSSHPSIHISIQPPYHHPSFGDGFRLSSSLTQVLAPVECAVDFERRHRNVRYTSNYYPNLLELA